MDINYEYEHLYLKDSPIYIRKFIRHDSQGRIHWHEAVEMLYFTHGRAVTACNLQEHHVQKGTIVLINGNELHTGIISQFDSMFYCIQFSPNFFHNIIGDKCLIFENIIKDEDCTKLLDRLIELNNEAHTCGQILESKKNRLRIVYFTGKPLHEKYFKRRRL